MCFRSVAHITAIPTFYEVPGELFKIKDKKESTDILKIGANLSHSIPVFHAGNQEQMVLSTLFESDYGTPLWLGRFLLSTFRHTFHLLTIKCCLGKISLYNTLIKTILHSSNFT